MGKVFIRGIWVHFHEAVTLNTLRVITALPNAILRYSDEKANKVIISDDSNSYIQLTQTTCYDANASRTL